MKPRLSPADTPGNRRFCPGTGAALTHRVAKARRAGPRGIGAWVIGAALVLALALPGRAPAQQPAAHGTEFGDWTIVCAPEAAGRTACALAQTLADPADGRMRAEIALNPVVRDEVPGLIMVLRTPSSMLLTVRPAFRVGAGPTVPLNWHTCAGDTCSALLTLGVDDITALRRGITMVVGYQPVGLDRPLTFPVSLRGTTAGLAALGVR